VVALAARSRLARPIVLPSGLKVTAATRRAPMIKVGDARGIDTYNSHPAVGLTADMLLSFYREAERGIPVQQFDCFDDLIEVDGHLRGLIGERIEFVSGADWTLKAGRPDKPSELAAAALEEQLRNHLGFREFIEHQLEAPHYGIAGTNLVWDVGDGGIVTPTEFRNAAHRRFASPRAELAGKIMLINGSTARDLVELEPGLWAISRYRGRNPWASGLMRTAAWWAMFKRWSVRDWQVFAEMFGLPLAIGYYEEGAALESRQALEDVVKAIGEDGYAVLSNLTEVVIKDTARSGDSSTVYPGIAALAEAQMSKLIAGATLSVDAGGPGSKGSYALGAVHEERAYALKRADARRVEEMFVRDVGRWFNAWNGYDRAAPPRLKIQITRDNLERAKVLETVGQIVDLDEDQIREEFSLRTPAPGKGVRFQAAKAAPGAPGGTDGKPTK
jgi:phage gp29-like protein